jgi:hypothetical protein
MVNGETRPTIELIEDGENGKWRIVLRNYPAFEKALGRDVVNAFSRCFVHADRLTSLASFAYCSEQHHGRQSVAFERDLLAMVWFTIGTLRELARTINALRGALAKKGILDAKSEPWVQLRELENRWDRDEFFRKKRDIAAFHVDEDVINKGLDELSKERDVDLSVGQGKKTVETHFTLGDTALFNGLGMDLDTYGQFASQVGDDHGVASGAIQEAFILASRAAGIPFGDN